MMNIDFANLQLQYKLYKDELDHAIHAVLDKSNYIMGEEVDQLEHSLEIYTGAKHAITCSSGTDALLLAMMAIDIQPYDEIITTPFTFISTAETIAFLKAKPVFVDIDDQTYNIDASKIVEKITEKTKAIISVSLYGQPAEMDTINRIAKEYNLKVIEDAAQSFGADYKDKKSCNLSDIGCTSFFPAKPLGCFGDGGALFTNDDVLAKKIKSLRLHGQTKRYHHKYIGMGGRLDTLQAAVLNVKLKYYSETLIKRQNVARYYNKVLKEKYETPYIQEKTTSVYAQYSIRVKNRDELQMKLKAEGVPTAVHYPIPLHLQEAFEYLGYNNGDFPVAEKICKEIISLPMNPFLTEEEIQYIGGKI